ncbi:MAG: aminopeptidase P N-terminal domain-containing protein [Herminiimonas sp.]|nr:aminopeptidase P N-terminal domain-containing protein [Herminiimonas sp.]
MPLREGSTVIANHAARRARLITRMQQAGGGVAIIPTAPEVMRNSDADYPYRHDSYFYYLSGFMEPEAVVVVVAPPDGSPGRSILFCREKNPEREIWDGFRYGPVAARDNFQFDEAFDHAALDIELPKLMADMPALFYAVGRDATLDAQVRGWMTSVRGQARAGVAAPAVMHDIRPLLDDMRLFKDADEIAIMRHAAGISGAAHARAMRMSAPGKTEYQIEAELLHAFRYAGSDFPAYTSIVATGANACVLHYRAGAAVLQDGDLVLIDAGCEYGGYASDITRTYPANGRFSPAQKRLYEIVLAAQQAAIDAVRPGATFMEGHDAAVRILAQGMLDTGLLDGAKVGSVEDVIAKGDYRQFYMHRTGHWLGMDVHDVGEYREAAAGVANAGTATETRDAKPWRILRPGMVLTVEPGIYVRPAEGVPEEYWNIGIRIEDDVAVTADGREVLSVSAPKTVAAIEAVMRGGE